MAESEKIRVLLADDEDRFRVTTTATLRKRGFQVTAVSSGFEAIDELKKNDIDVVILDVKMPGMDGHKALREIKRLKIDVEVIMLTGYGALDSALEGWHEGVFAYLTKPSSIEFLAHRIREAYKKKKGAFGQERCVKDIMEPLSALISTVREDQSVAEAIEAMRRFFGRTITATKHKETLLRSILVTDRDNTVVGVISIIDFLRELQPPCMRLSDDRSITGGSIFLNPPDYLGSFGSMICDMASKKVREVMPRKPPTIDASADLIEAANKLLSLRVQSLLVTEGKKAVGVLRDKDLFLEMANLIREHRIENETS